MTHSSFQNQRFNWLKALVSIRQKGWFPHLLITVWFLMPLLCGFFNLEQQSLIAHDEGLYITRARDILLGRDWVHPWDGIHHKTPGSYWLLAFIFQTFGVNEITARFPSVLASLACGLLLYELAKILVNVRVALWSALVLGTSFLWIQYSRFATPDTLYLAFFLAGLLCLLKAENSGKWAHSLRFTAGICWGLAFLVRSFLVMLPIAAILPYLIFENRRHRHLYDPWFYAGIAIGLLPTLLWIQACWQRFGSRIFESLMNFPVKKATGGKNNIAGFFFYLKSFAINSIPWGIFALVGLGLVFKNRTQRSQFWLLGVYPLIVFVAIGFSSTHQHHYSLPIYPILAMLAGITIEQCCRSTSRRVQRSLTTLALLFGLVSMVLVGVGGWVLLRGARSLDSADMILPYVPIALTLGLTWLVNTYFWVKDKNPSGWLVGLLLANWLTLSLTGLSGVLGNANPDLKAYLLQPEVQTILNQNVINHTPLNGKLDVLFRSYTPQYIKLPSVETVPPSGYAWVWEDSLDEIPVSYTPVSNFKEVFLVKLGP